jgi:ATP-dependent DNA helicase RecG
MKSNWTIPEAGEDSFTEFKRELPSPASLAEEVVAFLNFRGGNIYIGVDDSGSPCGIPIGDLKRVEETVMTICREHVVPPIIPTFRIVKSGTEPVVRIEIAEGLEKPYRTNTGKHMIRVGTTKRVASRQELARLFQNSLVLHIDGQAINGSRTTDLDDQVVAQYFKENYEIDVASMGRVAREKLLVDASILKSDGNSPVPTLVGLLMFAKPSVKNNISPLERVLPAAGTRIAVYQNRDLDPILDNCMLTEPLPKLITATLTKIRLNWRQTSKISGMKREENKFPERVFREILVNAFVHRDYSIASPVFVKMLPDQVEVISPGRLVNSVTINKMKAGISIARNPLIMKFMENHRFCDHLGRGIPMIVREAERNLWWDISFLEEDDSFRVRITIRTPGKMKKPKTHRTNTQRSIHNKGRLP